ncbi:hypothetical protein FNF28_03053 [Cafeteria roenbergensis]|uniref:Uncharacterized protein n=1 Tax=Cafeteria roenbergensis TaxID=33653 RepID=A0A5A8DNF3_CAFRO|nr:hypothetical protein FNF28_03053 [Cafeteria roenbergensis]
MRSTRSFLVAAAVAAAAASAAGLSTCSYEEIVANRFTQSTTPVTGWGALSGGGGYKAQGAIAVTGPGGAGDLVPGVVMTAADGKVRVHAVADALPRFGNSPAMTTDPYWTIGAAEAVVGGAQALGNVSAADAVVTTAKDGIVAVALGDLSKATSAAAGPGLAFVSCNTSLSQSGTLSAACRESGFVSCGAASWGAVHDTQVVPRGTGVPDVYIATDIGLARVSSMSVCSWPLQGKDITGDWPVQAVTAAPVMAAQWATDASGMAVPAAPVATGAVRVVAGGPWRMWVLDGETAEVNVWEWASNNTGGQGGSVSDAVTALAADWATGTVYVGTLSTVDVLFANDTLGRIDGYGGLPFPLVTSLEQAALAAQTALPLPLPAWSWRYMYLERWFAGPAITGVAAFGNSPVNAWPSGSTASPPVSAITSAQAPLAVPRSPPVAKTASADGEPAPLVAGTPYGRDGLTWLERQSWTLEAKAARMRQIQTRHNRHGMVAECGLSPMGDVTTCLNGPSDNNGLWTSLVSSAYALEYAITGEQRALDDARTFLAGLALLNDVTGIKGLMARSCIAPGAPPPGAGKWFNATAPGFEGWMWKGDTSSDEVSGHLFGWTLALTRLPFAQGDHIDKAAAASYLVDIATYIAENGFHLIDGDGKPTRWGDWSPKTLNNNRTWSDGRGVNSLEILSLLASATAAAPDLPDGGAAALPVLRAAWAELTNSTNRYPSNLRNLKIETPLDDNYSDDELTALPFYAWMAVAPQLPGPDGSSDDEVRACLAGMDRWWGQMAPLRSDWWAGITAGAASARASVGTIPSFHAASAAADALWNLQTWPLELIEWNVRNSHRQDITFYEYVDRSGRYNYDSVRVLPANERWQGRWNSNPHDLDSGGNGRYEMDGGVWLLPYWMARAEGLLA